MWWMSPFDATYKYIREMISKQKNERKIERLIHHQHHSHHNNRLFQNIRINTNIQKKFHKRVLANFISCGT